MLAYQFDYDPSGNLLFMSNGNGLEETRSYDGTNRPSSISVTGVLGRNYSYDANGNIVVINDQLDPAKSAGYGYDSLNRLTSAAGIWGSYSWSYDANGNRMSFQENDLPHIYTYAGNRLATRTVDLPETPEIETDIYQYDAAGNILNDGRRQYVYDRNNRVASTAVDGVTVGQYVYDSNEQRVIKTDVDGKTIFVYGLSGNLLAEVNGFTGKTIAEYVYIGSRQLARVNTKTIKDIEAVVDFDPNTLNLKSEGTWVTSYIELSEGYSAANIDTTTLLLNGTVPVDWYELGDHDADGVTDLMAKFSRDLVQETLGPGSTVPVMISGSGVDDIFTFQGMDVIRVLGKAGPKKGIPPSTEPPSEIVLEDTVIREYSYYHLDHLGTPQAMTDSTGAIIWQADYDPFGGLATLAGSKQNNFRFPGQYFDSETGLHYNWHRYYDPGTGRYLRPDPIGFDGGDLNLYQYAGANPINAIDPMGLEVWSFTKLQNSYQSRDEMLKGKNFPKWALKAIMSSNGGSCAARMSNAFNRAGYELLNKTTIRKVSDGIGNYYILGAHEFSSAVKMNNRKYRVASISCIEGKKGIIYFENYHIDLYTGSRMVGNGAVTEKYTKRVMYFMELNN